MCVRWRAPHLLANPSALSDSSTMSYCLSAFTTWFTSYDFSHSTGHTHKCTHPDTQIHTFVHIHTCVCVSDAYKHTHLTTVLHRGTLGQLSKCKHTLPAYGYTLHATCLWCNMSLTLFHAENFNHNIMRQVGVK